MPVDPETLNEKERQIYEELKEVTDPEIGASIVDMGLVDEISVKDGEARVIYHLTMPMCPPPMALMIGSSIKKKIFKIGGFSKIEVKVSDHLYKDQINKVLDEMKLSDLP
ncbi:MAG TPA: iron-sulfur cluster assembly protein [Thermoproteota archaeon]|nr:iron-sulfur cluster assembly protein [Thermoproteota archaeon]